MVNQGYKQTDVGLVPEDWDIKYLNDFGDVISGGTPSTSVGEYWDGDIAWCTPSDITSTMGKYIYKTDRNITHQGLKNSAATILPPNSILLCTRATIGELKLSGVPMATNQGFKNLCPNATGNVDYLYYLLQTKKKDMVELAIGSTFLEISKKALCSIALQTPSLPEQECIAEALSDVDSMVSSLEKLIAKKKAVKQGAMQELLTGKKRLPGFTGEWYETTIGEHCYVFDGTHQTPKYTIAGIPFYSVENVTANDFVNTKFITAEEHEQLSSKCKIKKGDILMTRIGSIGDCKYIDWDVNASFYVSLALIKCKETINAQFLSFYSTSSYFKKEIEIRSLLTAIPQKINLGPISEIRLYIPSDIKEQEAIASILSDMDNEIEALEQKLAKAHQVKQGMMQQLLVGTIRLV